MRKPSYRLYALAVAALPFIAPFTASAMDAAGNYAIWGQGARSCFQFMKTEGSPEATRYSDYVMGYLTAYNLLSEDTYSVTADEPLKTIMAELVLHCEDNQLDSFDRALKMVVEQHSAERKRTPGGNQVSWGRAPAKTKAK